MRINHNLQALNTYGNLTKAGAAGAKSMEKLSSGLRINRAGDDAAGLAISEKMRSQVRGLDQASRNSQDGISLIQTAEGALNETQSILQRMRELSVQAANDTNVDADRDALQNEIIQLGQEIDRIGNTTEFNTRKLLNGGANVSGTASDAANVRVVGGTGDTKVGTQITHGATTQAIAATATRANAFVGAEVDTNPLELNINGTSFSFAVGTTNEQVAQSINNAGLGVTATFNTDDLTLTANNAGSGSSFTSDAATAGTIATSTGTDATVVVGPGFTQYSAKGNIITIEDGNAKGLQIEISGASVGGTVDVDANGTLSLQIGANEGQEMNVSLSDMRSSALGVSGIDISSAARAKSAITTVDKAITAVSTERAKLGAFQNRLEHTINNLNTSSENLTAAESRVRDVDMAKEMMEMTKSNILQQASQAMLAQANQAPQGVLKLLQ